jgi:NTE family protein
MQRNGRKIGLVCGGGGILGGAWLVGALYALTEATGWQPSWADYIVGTSAGSVVAALVAEKIPPWFLVHHQRGGDVEGMTNGEGQPIAHADDTTRRLLSWTGELPRPILGSPALALRTALHPWRYPPAAAVTGWVGRGFLSTDEVCRMVEMVVPHGWSRHEHLWIVALDYATGKRVVFGRDDAPKAELWQAVTASCAIPGLYRPVRIDRRLYVDGGIWSPSNLDLLVDTDVDLVVALNPMSSLQPGLPTTIGERIERRLRRAFGRRFGREAHRLRDKGVELLLIQPGAEDLDAMGLNLMEPSRRIETLETAIETTAERLREPDARGVLEQLQNP